MLARMTAAELALELMTIHGSAIGYLEIHGVVYVHDHAIKVEKHEDLIRQPVMLVLSKVSSEEQRAKTVEVLTKYGSN